MAPLTSTAHEERVNTTGDLTLLVRSWRPAGPARGVVTIVPGFNSHSAYYQWPAEKLTTAGLATRNLDRRIELMFPVESPPAKRKVLDAMSALFRDDVKGRRLHPDGRWAVPPRPRGVEPFEAQRSFTSRPNDRQPARLA